MKTYNIFLDYYDKIVRSINNPVEDEVNFLVDECIRKYNPDAKTILETACWTGVVAKELVKKWFEVTGLDINENMLEKAEDNIDKKNLVLWDMTDFDLGKTFDTVLCNYNSICHLLTWQEWQSFFEMSAKHLDKWWLFVFDINTLFEFESITRDFAQFYNFWEDTVCLEMRKTSPQPSPLEEREQDQNINYSWFIYEWFIKIFKKSQDWRYDLIEEVVKENSFPISKIKKELKEKWFDILDIIDYHYGEVTAESERVYFICRKT